MMELKRGDAIMTKSAFLCNSTEEILTGIPFTPMSILEKHNTIIIQEKPNKIRRFVQFWWKKIRGSVSQ